MIGIIIDLIKSGMDFFTKKQTIQKEVQVTHTDGQVQTNQLEIEKTTIHWRNCLGFVITLVIAYSYIIIPIADFFGIVLIQMPLQPLIQILMIMLGGG